jgi:hypothetical protein
VEKLSQMLIFESRKSEHENDFNVYISISSRVLITIPLEV